MSQAGLIDFEGSDPQIPTTFITNDGDAVPIANTLEILATTVPAQSIPIQTTGSGNTVTIEAQLASSSAASDATQVGFAAFDSADFNVDANGFVSLAVTPMDNIQSIQVDNATVPGVNPVEPDGSGLLSISGNYVLNHAVPIETHSRALNEFNVEVQLAKSNATTNPLLSGLAHFNSTQFSVDANGFVELAGGGLAVDSIGVQATSGTGTDPVLPTAAGVIEFEGSTTAAGTNPVRVVSTAANTVQIQNQFSQALAATDATKVGLSNFNSTYFSCDANGFVSLTATATNDYHDTRFIVSAGGAADGANYTTIASAITAAVSAGGVQDIFIQPGTYTENLTWPANINLCAHIADRNTPTVTIIGKMTCTDAGARSASGIRFQTNSDNILSITGTANTQVTFDNCFINATNASAFNSTTTGTTSLIRCFYCNGDLGTTGIAYVSIAHGFFRAQWCDFRNSGASTTASTISSDATADILYTNFANVITHSSSALSSIWYSAVRAGATTCLTTSGTGSVSCKFSRFESQTASAISIGSGTTVTVDQCSFDSSNASVITGAGTLNAGDMTFTSTSRAVSTGLTRTAYPTSDSKLEWLSTQTASSSSSISFTSVITSAYSSYMLVITALQPATNTANLQLVFSANNGSSYLASNYLSGTLYTAITGTTFSNANSTADVRLSGPISSSGFFTGNYILTGFNTAGFGYVNGKSTWNDTTLTAYSNATTAGLNNGTTAINAIRLLMSSGNITAGTFTLYGIREAYS